VTIAKLQPRYVGDDWHFVATTEDDVSDYTSLHVTIRRHDSSRAAVIASTGTSTITTTGTNFATGTLAFQVSHTVTATASQAPNAFVEASVQSASLGGRQTILRLFMPIYGQVTVA
jgi:hypothetical protein